MSTTETTPEVQFSRYGIRRFEEHRIPLMPDPLRDQKEMFKCSHEVATPKYVWINLGRVQTEGAKQYAEHLEKLRGGDILVSSQGDVYEILRVGIEEQIQTKRELASHQQSTSIVEPECGTAAQSLPGLSAANETVPFAKRVEALQSWIADENDKAARFVLEQLKSERADTLWRAALVLATESIDFSRGDLRREATTVLQRVSLALRDERTPGIERAVFCAIARYASLVDPADADEFCAFLDRDGYVDTRLAALKAIVHLFEMSPPEHRDHTRLRDRIVELAQKFLDRDVFASGQSSAIAKEAIVATATLGDARLLDLVELAVQAKRDWFRRELCRRFDELRNLWTENAVEAKSEAFRQLECAIDSIKQ